MPTSWYSPLVRPVDPSTQHTSGWTHCCPLLAYPAYLRVYNCFCILMWERYYHSVCASVCVCVCVCVCVFQGQLKLPIAHWCHIRSPNEEDYLYFNFFFCLFVFSSASGAIILLSVAPVLGCVHWLSPAEHDETFLTRNMVARLKDYYGALMPAY